MSHSSKDTVESGENLDKNKDETSTSVEKDESASIPEVSLSVQYIGNFLKVRLREIKNLKAISGEIYVKSVLSSTKLSNDASASEEEMKAITTQKVDAIDIMSFAAKLSVSK